MSIITRSPTTANVTPEVAGRRLFESGQYWIEGDTGHVITGDHEEYVFAVPIDETGPRCYCNEYAAWGMCAHAACILNAMGEAEPA